MHAHFAHIYMHNNQDTSYIIYDHTQRIIYLSIYIYNIYTYIDISMHCY